MHNLKYARHVAIEGAETVAGEAVFSVEMAADDGKTKLAEELTKEQATGLFNIINFRLATSGGGGYLNVSKFPSIPPQWK